MDDIQLGASSSLDFSDNRHVSTAQRVLTGQTSTSQATIQRQTQNSSGLPETLQAGIESLSGMDMSDVQVHHNSNKPAQLSAHAYAQGNDIHLGPGQEKHLPHEAWHVAQQRQGRVNPTLQAKGIAINDDKSLETEADVMGGQAATLGSTLQSGQTTSLKKNPSAASAGHPIQAAWVDQGQGPVWIDDAVFFDWSTGQPLYAPGWTPMMMQDGNVIYVATHLLAPPPMMVPVPVAPVVAPPAELDAVDPAPPVEAEHADELDAPPPAAVQAPVEPEPPPVFNYTTDGIEFPAWTNSKVNGVNSPHSTAAKGDVAYVATVPTPAMGKDKGPTGIAAQYRAEGFASPADALNRFALMVAVNRIDTVTEAEATNQSSVTALVDEAEGYDGFRMGAIGFLWRASWRTADDGPADLGQVRAAAQASAENREAAQAQERASNKAGLINKARNMAMGFSGTGNAITHLSARFNQVYVHVGDPDAVNLKAKAEPDAAAATPLFDRFDTVLADAANPKLATGGYYFRGTTEAADDPHKAGAATAGAQTVATNRLDMAVRHAVASQNAKVPYYPEPNLLVRADQRTEENKDTMFGAGGPEYNKLIETLNPAAGEMAFDLRAAIYTDAGRFDQDVTGHAVHGDAHTRGMTSPAALFDPPRAKQSHAKYVELLGRIRKVHDNNNLIKPILKVMLPQEAMALTNDQDGAALAVAQANLDHFIAALTIVKDYIDANRAVNPLPNRPTVRAQLLGLGINDAILTDNYVTNVREALKAARTSAAGMDGILAIAKEAGNAIALYLRTFAPAAAVPP